jgi:dsDNA-specific endonuclease/ATPase MutS2
MSAQLAETTFRKTHHRLVGTPPLSSLEEIEKLLAETEIGGMLLPGQLTNVQYFNNTCRRMKGYLAKAQCSISTCRDTAAASTR